MFQTGVGDFVRLGANKTAKKKNRMPSFFEDEDSEQETTSNGDFLDIAKSKPRSIAGQRSSEPTPLEKDDFFFEEPNWNTSSPSTRTHSNTQDTSPKDRWYHYEAAKQKEDLEQLLEETKTKLQEVEEEKKKADEEAQVEIESLKIRLFHSVKAAKNYEEAEKLYHEVVTDKDLSMSDDAKILDIRHSFAAMLMEQSKFEAAEPISRAVWEQRKGSSDDLSEEAKQTHRQLCSILESLQRFEDAERMHRSMYHKQWKDAWALENGDKVCQVLAGQQQYEKAKTTQHDIWVERQKQLGQRGELTIQTSTRVLQFLERQIASASSEGGSRAQQKYANQRKRVLKDEHEVVLESVWAIHAQPESNAEILNAGHQLGVIHFHRAEFETARAVLEAVWEGRKIKFGETDPNTLTTGSMLGNALRFQGTRESVPWAIKILTGVWLARRSTLKSTDDQTITSGEDLAQFYYSLSELANAEPIYKWIVEQKSHKYGPTASETLEARWHLSQILYEQGDIRNREAQSVLGGLYNHWRLSSPRSAMTSQCGYMLAHSLSTEDEKLNEALDVARGVYDRKIALGETDPCFLNTGRLLGVMLMKAEDLSEAQKILGQLWDCQTKDFEELRIRLACGTLLGQCLSTQQKYPEAKDVLESLAEIQKAEFPADDPCIAETLILLDNLNESTKEPESKKSPKEHRNSRSTPKRRGGGFWGK
ncbi:hypothetical protein ACLMJK_008134 [Lecanora helva]